MHVSKIENGESKSTLIKMFVQHDFDSPFSILETFIPLPYYINTDQMLSISHLDVL